LCKFFPFCLSGSITSPQRKEVKEVSQRFSNFSFPPEWFTGITAEKKEKHGFADV
jgi:hypothetical protein